MSARVVVDVDGDAAQGRDFGRQLVEARVVLALALVGFGHGGLAVGIAVAVVAVAAVAVWVWNGWIGVIWLMAMARGRAEGG